MNPNEIFMAGKRPFLFLLLLLFFRGLISAQQDQSIDWNYEIDLLGRELPRKHKNLFFQSDSVEFFNALDHIADRAMEAVRDNHSN